MTNKTEQQRIYDGERAREVLDNEAFTGAFETIRQEYTEAWMNSPARDAEGREKLYLMMRLTDKLQSTLEAKLTDGKIAARELEHQARELAEQRREGVLIGSM